MRRLLPIPGLRIAVPQAGAQDRGGDGLRFLRNRARLQTERQEIMHNIDRRVVSDFGKEWSRFDQAEAPDDELRRLCERYFSLLAWDRLPPDARGFDLGCGSGRWAYFIAPRVGELHCIDPSAEALEVAKRKLSGAGNCHFHHAGVDDMPLEDNSMDFAYSLGVLHHVPDTAGGIRRCVSKLKPDAPLLLYLYYAFDNRPWWFKTLWKVSDAMRRGISISPYPVKYLVTQAIAVLVYYPLARCARLAGQAGFNTANFPLSSYRDMSLYTMRTDALDRFGTRLEKRFTRRQIEDMMRKAGLERIEFSEREPFWSVIGYKSPPTE